MQDDIEFLLQEVLSNQDLKAICQAPMKERAHPIARLLAFKKKEVEDLCSPASRQGEGLEYYNTCFALQAVRRKDISWLKRLRRRLAATNDYSEPTSALAEIRSYGYLLSAGFSVNQVPVGGTSTVDFRIKEPGGEEIEVEVYAKHYYDEETCALEQFHSAPPPTLKPGSICIQEHVTTPMGKPEPGKSITLKAIRKLAEMKEEEKQFAGTVPAILWLDFQDTLWALFPGPESVQPLRSDMHGFQSGELWYAFYGSRDLPIFEGHSIQQRALRTSVRMRRPGRFNKESKSNLSAAIVALRARTFLLENPYAFHPLPAWFWNRLTLVRRFDFSSCWADWPEKMLEQRVSAEIRRIEELAKLGISTW